MTTALDTSVLVAGLASWHAEHGRCRAALARLLAARTKPLVPEHSLVEAYSVLTRLPIAYRVAPEHARDLLRSALQSRARVVSERSSSVWTMLGESASLGTAGGAIYDLRILRAAHSGGADRLLTLNPRDFERFGIAEVQIVAP